MQKPRGREAIHNERGYSKDYSIQRDVEDEDALLAKTGAHSVFGLSSGGLISLQAALTLPAIHKVAIFEPPLFINGVPTAVLPRLEKEIAQGKVAAALITGMKATQVGPPIFNVIPSFLLELLTNMAKAQEEKKGSGEYLPLRVLAPTLQYDFRMVVEMSGAASELQGYTRRGAFARRAQESGLLES